MNLISLVSVPPIEPRWDAPWLAGLQVLVSYVLATAIVLALLALIVAIAALVFQGIFPSQVRDWAGKNIVIIFVAAAALGAVGGLFAWFINFDFGF
ncbi:hypothetical protein [Microbacterium arborescens]